MNHFVQPLRLVLAVLLSFLAWGALSAETYPSKPVRFVVTFPPGGPTDTIVRVIGERLTNLWGHPMILDNRGGAGGIVGGEIVAKAPADGYTLLFTTASLAVNVTLYKKIGYDAVRDFAPISRFSSAPLILVVHPNVPAKNVKELVALAKKHKTKLNAGSNGTGTTSHLAIEMLKQAAGIDLVHITYKGGGPAVVAMMAGEIDLRFSGALAVLPHVKQGRVRPIAVAAERSSAVMPGVPTLSSTYPGFDVDNWYALFAPANTPREIITKLHAEVVKVLAAPEMREAISKDGAEPVGSTPEELAAFFRKEVAKYAKVIAAANVRAD